MDLFLLDNEEVLLHSATKIEKYASYKPVAQMARRVINLKGRKPQSIDEKTEVYIGRAQHMGGWHLSESTFANPFHSKTMSLNDRICLYKEFISAQNQLHLRELLPTLAGKDLACWCAPDKCHGDILRRLSGNTSRGQVTSRPASRSKKSAATTTIDIGGQPYYCIDTLGAYYGLHPNNVGPITITEREIRALSPRNGTSETKTYTAKSMTCLWNGIQVPGFLRLGNIPAHIWFRSRDNIFAGGRPLYDCSDITDPENTMCYFRGEYLTPDLAWLIVFIMNYAMHVEATPEYIKVQDMVARGHDVCILGPNGRDVPNLKNELDASILKFSYELILTGMLRGDRVWDIAPKKS